MFSKFASLTLVQLNISMNFSSTRIRWLLEFANSSLVPQLSQLSSLALTPLLSLPPMHLYIYIYINDVSFKTQKKKKKDIFSS